MQKLFFFNTDEIPRGVVASTARKGNDWNERANVGDIVAVHTVGEPGAPVFHSVVVHKETLSYYEVLDAAGNSTVGHGTGKKQRPALYDTLHRAYGHLESTDIFTVLHLLPLNNTRDAANSVVSELASKVCDETIQASEAAVKQARAIAFQQQTFAKSIYDASMELARKLGEDLKSETERANALEEQLEAALEPDQEESRRNIDFGMDATAIALAAREENVAIRSLTKSEVVGDITSILRVEF